MTVKELITELNKYIGFYNVYIEGLDKMFLYDKFEIKNVSSWENKKIKDDAIVISVNLDSYSEDKKSKRI